MRLVDLLYPGGQAPQSTSDWIVLILTAAFAVFAISFMTLLALVLLFGIVAVFERLMVWNL